MEYINVTKVSPLLDKVQIKVCYVGQETNRNGTVITKEVATKLGENICGTPVVGYYNEEKQDFEQHNREVVIEKGKYKLLDTTKAYGFVPTDAKVWFEKFDDEGTIHEYLCTEGYLWTGIYEESQRVVDKGNNQSMELHDKTLQGFWTNDDKYNKRVFIISDGLIEKLCILGSDVEPCFEGAQIKAFSLEDPEFIEFKNTMFSMINDLKDTLNKGGFGINMDNEKIVTPEEEILPTDFKKDEKEEEKKQEQDKETSNDTSEKEDKEEKDEKKKKYELSEIAEYVSLQLRFDELQNKYSSLEQEHQTLTKEVEELRAFKLAANRKEKEAMIESFYMLSNEDKKDVIDNLDTYSLDDIEAKLSIICVRNKVNFNLDEDKTRDEDAQLIYNLQNETDDTPTWVKSVRSKME